MALTRIRDDDFETVSPYELPHRCRRIFDQMLLSGISDELSAFRQSARNQERDVRGGADEQRFVASVIRKRLRTFAERDIAEGRKALTAQEEDLVARATMAEQFGASVFQPYIEDDQIENVDCVGHTKTIVTYADGRVVELPGLWPSRDAMVLCIQRLADRFGGHAFDTTNCDVVIDLPGMARLAAMQDVSVEPMVSMRRQRLRDVTLDELHRLGMFDADVLEFLRFVVRAGLNVLISGAMRAGKTTMLIGLASEFEPLRDRVMTVEQVKELFLERLERHRNIMAVLAKPANTEGHGEVAMGDLVQKALKYNINRVIVGEVVGGEITHLLNVMTNGCTGGSMCTIHADSARAVIDRMALLCSQAPERYDRATALQMISQSVDIIVHIDFDPYSSTRRVSSIVALGDVKDGVDDVLIDEIFTVDEHGHGRLVQTFPAKIARKLRRAGWVNRRPPGYVA
jgi:pilus assembly protein CpaF